MTQSRTVRVVVTTAVGAATTIGLLAGAGDAFAARKNKKKQRKPADVIQMQTPLGLQGVRGAGNNVVTPFSLLDKSRRKTDIQAEYGWDRNNDGTVADGTNPDLPSEYEAATEDRRDSRNTRKNKKPQLFSTAGDIGASHAFVWNSAADVSTGNFPTVQFLYTPDGRPVPDPNNPGSFLFDDILPGMKIRIRAKAKSGRGVGEWIYTDAFALNNNTPPSMTIDGVVPNSTSTPTASDEVVEINWTAFDDDSEDLNGNGVLDLLDLEDRNGNGVLDPEYIAVAFDYYRVPDGVDPATLSQSELDALLWLPCTRAEGFGTEPSAPPELRIDGYPTAPTGVGRAHVWAWDSVADVGTVNARYILRASPFDQKREPGATIYFTEGFQLDNWKIFNSPGEASNLPGGRVGGAIVNLTPGLSRSDPAYEPPLQSWLYTGGSSTDGGPGTSYLAVQIVNTETAETTTSSAAPFTAMLDARSYHTATVLDDGRVLIAGGFDAGGNPLATTEIYDPATHNITSGPSLLTARARHSAVRLASGQVAFFGGVGAGGATLSACETYVFSPEGSPQSANVALPDLAVAQHTLHARLLPDQRVLVAGGVSAGGTAVQTAEVLNPLFDADPADPTTKNPRFEEVGSMGDARMFASATTLHDGNILFAGGSASPAKTTLEVFNWINRQFEPVVGDDANMEIGRTQHAAALLGDGTVVLAGGITDTDGGTLIADADVFLLGARASDDMGFPSTWSGSFLPVNGDMRFARRSHKAVTVNNGRVFFVGGLNATGGALQELETFTPEGGANFRPSARTDLESKQQSWAFGAPIVYRVTDAEQDNVRVVVQWSDNAGAIWRAAAPQASTIGGNVAEPAANRTTGAVDDQTAAIDPKSFPQSDHDYIWGMTQDIPRPPQGGSSGPYIFRTTPFGAVQGSGSQSVPVTVLFNTKVIPTIIALENADGTINPNQGGDIGFWVHLRDIDGEGVGPRPGDDARAIFEYAVDANNDGIINPGQEFWNPASATTAGVDETQRGANGANVVEDLVTWSESPLNSDPVNRPANQGWLFFDWDSLFDLGAPQSSWGNVWFRVRPFDNLSADSPDEGFTATIRNESGKDESIRVIRDPDALWLDSMTARGGDNNLVAINEPVDFNFNGLVDAESVNAATIQISRNGTQILGVYTTEQNLSTNTTVVTFFPRPNSTILDQLEYTEQSVPTVLFPLNSYDVLIPGYPVQTDPRIDDPQTLRPDNAGFPAVMQTYLLAQNVPISTSFTTRTGNYDNGQDVAVTIIDPVIGSTLVPGGTFSVSYDQALDLNTVKSPNAVVTIDNSGGSSAARSGAPVVAGRWSVTNSQNGDGTTSSVAVFTPLLQLPSGRTVDVQTFNGLHGANGRPTGAVNHSYSVTAFGTTNVTGVESFSNTDQEDASGTDLADWGDDPCNPGVLTGLQDSATQPQGGPDYLVAAGVTRTITQAVSDFGNFTVEKGGKLLIRSTAGAVTIRTTGNVSILGVVDFRGEDGWTGAYGNTASRTSLLFASRGVGTRKGGRAYNDGGAGGDSDSSSSLVRVAGDDGSGDEGGEGGNIATAGSTSSYVYGAGGGAGGGHARAGLSGGAGVAYSTASNLGPKSVPGGITGDTTMASGRPSTGGGGGGGGSNRYSSSWYHQGGGGGASAGAVTFICNGTFDIAPSGYIDGRGGRGGSSATYAGSGGGGAGGGLLIKSAGRCTLDGIVDLRGGLGGPASFGYWQDFYALSNAFNNGTSRYGGDGGPGRFRVEAPNFLNHDEVRVKGQLMISQVTSIPSSGIGGAVAPPAAFQNGGTVAFGATSKVRYTQLIVPAGVTVTLTGTNATSIYVDGEVRIDGTLKMSGGRPLKGFSGSASNGMSGTHPEFAGGAGTPATQYTGGLGALGGGKGGAGHTIGGASNAGNGFKRAGQNGSGPAPGRSHALKDSKGAIGYAWSGGRYIFYTGDMGGGGGSSATTGDDGWAPYAVSGYYAYEGAVDDSNGDGRSPADVRTDGSNTRSTVERVDATNIDETNLASFVGSGAAGGGLGGYTYSPSSWHYFGLTGSGGGAAGALGIIGSGTVTVNGTIEAKGGDGNPPGAGAMSVTVWNWSTGSRSSYGYAHSGGGGASGGTVYIVGDNVNISPVTVGEGAGANGATLDLQGGVGGGRRQFRNSGNSNKYPAYNTMGNFGGDGGFGRAVIRYKTSLNNGRQLFNRWGMEQSVFENNNERYTVLAGSASAACRGLPGGSTFKSQFYDLASFAPVVNRLDPAVQTNVTYTILGEGAQSDPHDPGLGGTGVADPDNTSGFQSSGAAMLDGWRWLRSRGTIARPTTNPTDPAPVLDDIEWDYTTDDVGSDED